jgi:hypothetical protein
MSGGGGGILFGWLRVNFSSHLFGWYAERTIATLSVAEKAGFEPACPSRGPKVFETWPFNHSGTSPKIGDTFFGAYDWRVCSL